MREVLHRDEFAAIQLAEHSDASVHRFINQATVVLPCDDDSTRAAIAFGAAFLGSGRALLQPQPVEHRGLRREPIEPNGAIFSAKLNTVSGHLASATDATAINGHTGIVSAIM
jgi:hypothetical protein